MLYIEHIMEERTVSHYIKSGWRIHSICGLNKLYYPEDIDLVTTNKENVTCKECLRRLSKM